ncbi:MAG: flagellar hook-basal body complex protein, partial [Candidatus Adiutrix sp.]|nr:flagellar hook-basal body complex protein [Candidatus Adiutrix sp.]
MSFSSMYIAATGMISLGTGMQTISNNLANIETNGFKTMRTNYSDLISETLYTGAGRQQVGRGSQVCSIQSMFTQGAFKSSESPTDLALAGDGFFAVRTRLSYNLPNSDQIMYTRAGAYTFDKNGYMEDPSGNILQGWAMSLPRPGETAVRLGSPVDIRITALTIPPQATTIMRQAVNLDADARAAYDYPAYELAESYAREQAERAGEAARGPAEKAVWNPVTDREISPNSAGVFSASNKDEFNRLFLERYNDLYSASLSTSGDAAHTVVSAMSLVTPPPAPDRAAGQMTFSEFSALTALVTADLTALAAEAGRAAHTRAYENTYDTVYRQYSSGVPASSQWLWEGNGYAGAWDGSRNPPLARDNYSHAEYQTVYDGSGRAHVLTTYYQKNPHAENVWDYLVTCDPTEDDRLDSAGRPVAGGVQAGLLQKGKITFDADGRIKDLEAQDLNPAAGFAAYTDPPVPGPGASAMAGLTLGGYYTGPGTIDPATGARVSAPRAYTITYGYLDPDSGQWLSANTSLNPPARGFTWNDGLTSGFVAVDPGYPGPYPLGNDGLTLTFNFDAATQPGLNFGAPGLDTARVTAHSEQLGWAAGAPDGAGYFDVNVKFRNAPAAQAIALDMGAHKAGGLWLLDAVSTTQYAGNYVTVSSRQDGYPQGSLSRIYVTENGLVTGVYSNNRELELYQISITRFLNPWGLSKMGNNLFAVTRHSGEGVTSPPGENGAGTVIGNFLEQSNVDTATEIVNMI